MTVAQEVLTSLYKKKKKHFKEYYESEWLKGQTHAPQVHPILPPPVSYPVITSSTSQFLPLCL